jgi:hypothetical protein
MSFPMATASGSIFGLKTDLFTSAHVAGPGSDPRATHVSYSQRRAPA